MALLSRRLILLYLASLASWAAWCQSPPLPLDQAGLEWYLSRAVSAADMVCGQGDIQASLEFLTRTGARFAGRAMLVWAWESLAPAKFRQAAENARIFHGAIPELILQGCIFEAVTQDVGKVPVPAWAFEGLGLPVETRNFRYRDMLFPRGQKTGYNQWSEFEPTDHWALGSSIPDIRRTETRLWFYWLGCNYIDAGFESLHLGQIQLMAYRDKGHQGYTTLVTALGRYAASHGRRGFVLFDAHAMGFDITGSDGRLLLDFGASFSAMTENPPFPGAVLVPNPKIGTPWGRSPSGITRSGWRCQSLPYLVELDNWGIDATTGQVSKDAASVYGWDEISWFSNLDKTSRDAWLVYQARRVKELDPSAWFEFPLLRGVTGNLAGLEQYYAVDPTERVPWGFGQTQTIARLIAAQSTTPGAEASGQ